jgi:hypothetical protein
MPDPAEGDPEEMEGEEGEGGEADEETGEEAERWRGEEGCFRLVRRAARSSCCCACVVCWGVRDKLTTGRQRERSSEIRSIWPAGANKTH